MRNAGGTVADLRARKRKTRLSQLCVAMLDEARASAAAGNDLLQVIRPIWSPEMCEAAGGAYPGPDLGASVSDDGCARFLAGLDGTA